METLTDFFTTYTNTESHMTVLAAQVKRGNLNKLADAVGGHVGPATTLSGPFLQIISKDPKYQPHDIANIGDYLLWAARGAILVVDQDVFENTYKENRNG